MKARLIRLKGQVVAQWRALPVETRSRVAVGGVVGGMFLFWLVVALPMSRRVAALKAQAPGRVQALATMRAQAQEVSRLRASGAQGRAPADVTTAVEQSAEQYGLNAGIVSISQDETGAMELTLKDVAFGRMLRWTNRLRTDHGLRVVKATLERTPDEGFVDAKLVLR